MNCKQDEIAIVVRTQRNNDKIVRCVRLVSDQEFLDRTNFNDNTHGPIWEVDRDMLWGSLISSLVADVMVPFMPDANLRPIRGTEGTDEMIQLVGLPGKISEPA